MARKKRVKASSSPAEAPIPTTAQTACRWRFPAARPAGLRRPTSRGPFCPGVRVRFACRTIGSLANPDPAHQPQATPRGSPNGVCSMRRDRPGRRRPQPADHSALRVQGWPPRSSRVTAPSGMGRALRRLDPRQQRARSLRSPGLIRSSWRGRASARPAPSGRPRAGAAPLREPILGDISDGSPHRTRSWRRPGPRDQRAPPSRAALDPCGPQHDRVEENLRPRRRGGGTPLRSPWGHPFRKRQLRCSAL